jgi:hypothetical protein
MNFNRITLISNIKIWFLSSLISSTISSGIFLILQFFGLFEFIVTPAGSDLKWSNIASGAFMFPLVGIVIYSCLQFFTAQHLKIFRRVGYGFLIFSFLLPLQLEDASTFEKIILMVIHIIISLVFIEWLTAFHKTLISTNTALESPVDKK